MGVREAWEAFHQFESLVRRPDREEPVAAFLEAWEVAGQRLAAAAPNCCYPDPLLAFKLLLAYRPAQPELELIISRLEGKLVTSSCLLLPRVVESLLEGAESCCPASPLVKLDIKEEEEPACLTPPQEQGTHLTEGTFRQGQSDETNCRDRQAVDRQKACLSAVATDRPSEQRPEAENVSLQAVGTNGDTAVDSGLSRVKRGNSWDYEEVDKDHEARKSALKVDTSLSPTSHRCRQCPMVCDSQPALRKHRRVVHASEFKCDQCAKSFPSVERLKRHYRVHTGEKPFACDLCTKCYSHYSILHAHRKRHAGVRNFLCEICNKTFMFKKDLERHIEFHSDDRPFKCEFCPSAFRRKEFLNDHRMIHTGERNFQCEYCSKAFRLRVSLQRHTRIHTGEKPYQCEVCSKRFVQCGDMKKHRQIHTRKEEVIQAML